MSQRRPSREQILQVLEVTGPGPSIEELAALLPMGAVIRRTDYSWRIEVPEFDAYGARTHREQWFTHTSLRVAMLHAVAFLERCS